MCIRAEDAIGQAECEGQSTILLLDTRGTIKCLPERIARGGQIPGLRIVREGIPVNVTSMVHLIVISVNRQHKGEENSQPKPENQRQQ